MKYSTIEVTGDVKIGSGGRTYEGEYVVTPSSAEQVLETAGFTLANDVVVEAIPSEYVDTSDANATANDILSNKTAYVDGAKITGEIPVKYSSDVTVSGADVTVTKGYYGNNITKTIPSGSISNLTFFDDFSQEPSTVHVSVDYTVNGGYMEGGRYIRGNHVITASQLVSGTQNITQNGTTDITNFKYVNVNVPNPSTGSLSITSNNTYDVTNYASAVVNVPNPSTGSISITSNNTYDVTNYASAVVNVPQGITPTGTISITTNGTVDVTNYASADVSVSGVSIDDIARNLAPSGAITLGSNVTEVSKYAFARKPITSVVGESVTSILEDAFYYCSNLASVSFPNLVSTTGGSTFRGCALTSVNFPELTTLGSTYVFSDNADLETGVFPKLTSTNQSLRNSRFLTLDFGKKISIGNYWFADCGRLTTLILRSTELCPCTNTGGFNGTPFKNGGTGGTIYIPKSLYDHLGDGTANDYQSASNWSTIYGYGTITWAKIEGSYYETHYADGTPIGA